MSETNEYLKTIAPESTSLNRFLRLNFQEDTANALNAAVVAGNQDIVIDLLKSKLLLESQDTKEINIRKFKGSISDILVTNNEYSIHDLPEHMREAINVVGASMGLCEYGDDEQKNKLFDSLDRAHDQITRENEKNAQRLKSSGELAPSMTITPDL